MAFMLYEILVVTDLGADKVVLQIRMNRPRGVLRIRTLSDGPGAALFFADSKKRNKTEKVIRRADQPFRTGLRQSIVRQETLQFVRRQLRHFRFEFPANDRALGFSPYRI